jgi:predicted regulator of Ras-like GTPase activity (Roadblock/LC7/MglB family)
MAGAQTSEVESYLQGWLAENPSVVGFVILNADGIPVKLHDKIPYEKAVQYAALMSDIAMQSRKCLRELQAGVDAELTNVRMRTKEGTEVIAIPSAEYTIVVVQNCSNHPNTFFWPPDESGGGGGEG